MLEDYKYFKEIVVQIAKELKKLYKRNINYVLTFQDNNELYDMYVMFYDDKQSIVSQYDTIEASELQIGKTIVGTELEPKIKNLYVQMFEWKLKINHLRLEDFITDEVLEETTDTNEIS